MKNGKRTAALSGSAALALGLVGVLVPVGANAEEITEAPTEGAAYDQSAQQLLSDDNLAGVGVDGDGNVVLLTTATEGELAPETQAFLDANDNVVVTQLDGPLTTAATNDLVGGAGYLVSDGTGFNYACSVGFSAWTPSGAPAFVSAGHCAGVGGVYNTAALSVPSSDPAAGGPGFVQGPVIGNLGWSRYGGAGDGLGNTDLNSVDFSAWNITNADLNLLPSVTNWSTAAGNDLAAGLATTITEIGDAAVGDQIGRSGRTTGHQTGEVLQVKTWAKITEEDGTPHYVYGFLTTAPSAGGDSGGSFYRGSTAVGVLSGGGELSDGTEVSFAADLKAGLALAGGYTVKLHLDAPAVTTSGTIPGGSAITGTARANSQVVVTVAGAETTVTSDASGNWSVAAPTDPGTYDVSAIVKDGFNTSAAGTGSVTVGLTAPVFTAPAERTVDKVTVITGTAVADGEITLTGDVTATTTVGADGTWSVPVDLTYGGYAVTATVAKNGSVSPASTLTFSVVPTAPAITSVAPGQVFEANEAPTSFSGTGVAGANVQVFVDSVPAGTTTVNEDGTWTVTLPVREAREFVNNAESGDATLYEIPAGEHTVSATQAINSGTSSAASVAFTVKAAATPTPTAPGPGGNLPETGTTDAAPLALGALLLLVVGGGAIVAARRVRSAQR